MLAVVSGTKMKPMPMPERMFGQVTLLVAISRLMLPNCQQE